MNVNKNTRNKAMALFRAYGIEGVFGRSDVATITAGQIGLFIPIGEEIVEQFLPLAKKMKKVKF